MSPITTRSFPSSQSTVSARPSSIRRIDCVVIVTTHTGIDYDDLVKQAPLVVDLRNATGHNGTSNRKVWKL